MEPTTVELSPSGRHGSGLMTRLETCDFSDDCPKYTFGILPPAAAAAAAAAAIADAHS
jgi:hypothetical protein